MTATLGDSIKKAVDLGYIKVSDLIEGKEFNVTIPVVNGDNDDSFGEFKKWSSTPRWHKGLHITEKIDGTNACVVVGDGWVKAQSRKRLITPDNDNFGFARWVHDNAGALTDALGFGYHYGEWFGEGIQKNPLQILGRRFALFNTWHWARPENAERLEMVDGLEHVPVLHDENIHGPATWETIPLILQELSTWGSKVRGLPAIWDDKSGFYTTPKPEGIIVWHRETQQKYKILLEGDAFHKHQL